MKSPMKRFSNLFALLTCTLVACDCDYVPPSDDETGTTGTMGDGDGDSDGEQPPCPGLPLDWPSGEPIGCKPLGCVLDDGGRLTCVAAMYVAPGHWGDFAISPSAGPIAGEAPWNEWPYNADAGTWEDAEYVGQGVVCGTFAFNTAELEAGAVGGPPFVEISCTDWTAGWFTTARVLLTEQGPVVEPEQPEIQPFDLHVL
jgi:hypothetical protein